MSQVLVSGAGRTIPVEADDMMLIVALAHTGLNERIVQVDSELTRKDLKKVDLTVQLLYDLATKVTEDGRP